MIRSIFFIAVILMTGCSDRNDEKKASSSAKTESIGVEKIDTIVTTPPRPKVYANARFKNVMVEKLGLNRYKLAGQGQIFEASFNWVIEDGHNELKSGYTTTDAGAPEWGNFEMIVTVPDKRANSVPHIILFEASAEDGRRTHELAIPLP